MWVPPHPHTGLQTVTWLFEGLGRHTDSLGSDQLIRPGQLNVMTAGHGICHAEVSPGGGAADAARPPAVGGAARLRPRRAGRPTSPTSPSCPAGAPSGVEVTVLVGRPRRSRLARSGVHPAGGRRDPARGRRLGRARAPRGLRVRRARRGGRRRRRRRRPDGPAAVLPRAGPLHGPAVGGGRAGDRRAPRAASRSPRRSSCGGTSSAAATRRSSSSARRGTAPGCDVRPRAVRRGRGLRRRPAAGAAAAEHPPQAPLSAAPGTSPGTGTPVTTDFLWGTCGKWDARAPQWRSDP